MEVGVSLMAESQGFEPWVVVKPRWFSRPVHSTALSTLREADIILGLV